MKISTNTSLMTLIALLIFLIPSLAFSHHEAIVGPHAPAFFSNKGFLGVQAFNIASRNGETSEYEQVGLVSAGVTLGTDSPFSLAVLQPFSMSPENCLTSPTGCGKQFNAEDTILALRYHHNFESLQNDWNAEGNFITIVAGAEFPTGNADGQQPFSGPLDTLLAGLASIERGNWSGIAYVYRRFNGYTREGSKNGNLFYVGGGVGYGLWEDQHSHQSVNLQAGISFEHTGETTLNGVDDPLTDGWGLMLQPTIAYTLGDHWNLFMTFGFPLTHDSPEPQLWRAGLGMIYTFSESGHKHHVPTPTDHSHGHTHETHAH